MHDCPTHGPYPCKNPQTGLCRGAGLVIPITDQGDGLWLHRENFLNESDWRKYLALEGRMPIEGMPSGRHTAIPSSGQRSQRSSHCGDQRASQFRLGNRHHGSNTSASSHSMRYTGNRTPPYAISTCHESFAPPSSHRASRQHNEHSLSQGYRSFVPSSLQAHGPQTRPYGQRGASSRGDGHGHGYGPSPLGNA